MKISIDTSSFSFRFIGIWLVILSIIVFLLFCRIAGTVILLIGLLLVIQKYSYLIPKKSDRVSAQVEKTLKTLALEYQKTPTGFSTKTTHITISNYGLCTILRCRFDKVYTVQGKYVAGTIVKYQRYS